MGCGGGGMIMPPPVSVQKAQLQNPPKSMHEPIEQLPLHAGACALPHTGNVVVVLDVLVVVLVVSVVVVVAVLVVVVGACVVVVLEVVVVAQGLGEHVPVPILVPPFFRHALSGFTWHIAVPPSTVWQHRIAVVLTAGVEASDPHGSAA